MSSKAINADALHQAVRFVARATTFGMVVVIAFQIAGRLNPGVGLVDILVLFLIGTAARMVLRSWY